MNYNMVNYENKKNGFDRDTHNHNIERRMMERNGMFGAVTRDDTSATKKSSNVSSDTNFSDRNIFSQTNNIGEITGDSFDETEVTQGMPLRPSMASRSKDRYAGNNDDTIYNHHLDFDLYASKPNIKVSYNDPMNYSPNTSSSNMEFAQLDDNQQTLAAQKITRSSIVSSINNNFTLDFLSKFYKNTRDKKSTILSPFSIFQLFTILYISSKNKTEAELKEYFNYPDKNLTYDTLNKVNSLLETSGSFKKMNLICVPSNSNINKAFTTYISKLGVIYSLNINDPQNESSKLNNIISKSTNGMIRDIIKPSMINLNTSLMLVNTLYFYSKWKKSFNSQLTKKMIFNGIQQKSQIDMMKQNDIKTRYFENDINQILELDYQDESFCMGFILPKQVDVTKSIKIPDVVHDEFEYYISELQETKINTLQIPKFKHESRYKIDNLFKKYGLIEVFTDLDCPELLSSSGSYISDIIHQAVIVVNEVGVEASSATVVTRIYASAAPSKTKEINFIAHHPFLYYIRYKPQNIILFVGKYL